MPYISDVINELYNIFDILNSKYFNSRVNKPIITVMRTKPNILGHFTLDKVWRSIENKEGIYHEINISPYILSRDIVKICEVMCHEMVHAFNLQSGIKDVSGQVHNKKFKIAAENAGLECIKMQKVGYVTIASAEFTDFIINNLAIDASVFELYREEYQKPPKEKSQKKLFKYVCCGCNKSFTSKFDDIMALCSGCEGVFELQEDENREGEENNEN